MAKLMGFHFLLYVGDYVDQSLSGMVTTEKMLKEKPDVVKRVLRGTVKSLRYIRSNQAETVRYIRLPDGTSNRHLRMSFIVPCSSLTLPMAQWQKKGFAT